MKQEHKEAEISIDSLLISSKKSLDDGAEGPEIARDLIERGARLSQIRAVLDELNLLLPPSGKPEELRATLRPEPISPPHHRESHPRIEIIDLSK